MSLHRQGRQQQQARESAAPTLAGSGGWARVSSVDVPAGTVRVTFAEFDGGLHAFGPVPYRTFGVDPVAGETVWLLVASTGEPGLALVL
jgi:hypothetical protein